MGVAMRLILGIVVFIALTSSLINGEVYTVGASDGWTSVSHVDYKHWADTKQFHVGDIIIFRYNQEFHNVIQVSYENYKACNATNPFVTYATGNDSITIKYPGHFFYICSFPQHCQSGQKVDIRVPHPLAPESAAPQPTLPPTSAPRIPPVPGNGTGSSTLNSKCGFFTVVVLAVFTSIFAY
ncbi:mavicyanin-like [Apium graveolens]|uniref:mavicyanin-like n=1 Tax=Apium graveolens TaxID=4045 RepID=UPI003D797492